MRKLLNKIYRRDSGDKLLLDQLIFDIQLISKSGYKQLAICLENTNSSFLGIKNATLNLFPKNTIVFPAYYSEIKFNQSQLITIIDEIKRNHFETIIVSTLPISMNFFVDKLAESERVNLIFHGALSELSNPKIEKQLFKMIQDVQSGKINRIGFVKSGLDKWAKSVFNIDCTQLQLRPLGKIDFGFDSNKSASKIKIGVFGNTSFNKNLFNQIAGALAVENTEIHTTINTGFEELGFKDRLVIHPFLSHFDFLKLMAQMDINLHLSFSEGMGGQIFTESLSQGVPCLTSYNNEYLKYDQFLLDLLTVKQYENPWEIKRSIENILLVEKGDLEKRLIEYSMYIEEEHTRLLTEFLKN